MEWYRFDKIQKILCLGSINSDLETLLYIIKSGSTKKVIRRKNEGETLNKNSLIIVCGDSGFGIVDHDRQINLLVQINSFCEENNINVIFIRGNHDDPSYFNNKIINLSNVKLIPDYSIVTTENRTILCIGGGISNDRSWRIEQEKLINKYKTTNKRKLYYENEAISMNEEAISSIIKNKIKIDTIISHMSPISSYPTMKMEDKYIEYWKDDDKELKNDIINNRKNLEIILSTLIKENIPIKQWIFGHHHVYDEMQKNDISFISLDNNFTIINLLENEEKNKQKINDQYITFFDYNIV